MSLADVRTSRSLIFSVVLGLLSGGVLAHTRVTTGPGWDRFLLTAYAVVVLGPAIYVRWKRVPSFAARFLCTLIAFMTMTVILHITLLVADPNAGSITVFGHIWRMGMMLAIGSVLSGAVAQLTGTRAVASHP